MNLDQVFQRYKGQSVSFDKIEANRGQCVQWIEFVHTEAYGHPPHYADAINWWNDPKELLNFYDKIGTGTLPKKGDLVVWGAGVGSQFGHIDVVMQDGNPGGFQGADSNWNGDKTVHLVQHDYRYVLGYLRPKGGVMEPGDYRVNDGDIQNYFKNFLGRDATEEDKQVYRGKTHKNIIYAIIDSGEFKNKQNAGFIPVTDQLYKKG